MEQYVSFVNLKKEKGNMMTNTIPVEKNKDYRVKIEDLSRDGVGVCKVENFTIFVADSAIGDVCDIKILKVKKNYAFGKIIKIIEPSKDRVEPICEFSKRCGGCQLQHLSYQSQLEFKTKKVKECLERLGGFQNVDVLPTIGAKNVLNYRNKCQFPVGMGKDGDLNIGFYSARSHNIVDVEGCHIQHPINDKIIQIIRGFLSENNISIYNEESGKGLIRHIITRIGFITGEIMVCIVINGDKLPLWDKLVDKLKDIEGMTSIVININKKKTNVIMGEKVKTLWGKDYITDYIGDIKFEISPLSFYQVNPEQTEVLYKKAIEFAQLNENDTVFDIYCGIGTISLFIAKKVKSVIGVEIVPEAIEDAKHNAEINGIKNAEFIAGPAEVVIPEIYKKGKRANVVVVDPPRKGCDIKVIDTIINMNPERIVYVSCDPASLARDVKILCENGFEIGKVQPVDQFIMSEHIETVCLLNRVNI